GAPAGVRVAVPLDQGADRGDLHGQAVARLRGAQDGGEPRLDVALLDAEAQRARAQRLERGERIEEEEAAERGRADGAARSGHAVDEAARPTATEEPASERRRQGIGDLLGARVHKLGDLQNFAPAELHLLAYACEARWADLELGDTDRI